MSFLRLTWAVWCKTTDIKVKLLHISQLPRLCQTEYVSLSCRNNNINNINYLSVWSTVLFAQSRTLDDLIGGRMRVGSTAINPRARDSRSIFDWLKMRSGFICSHSEKLRKQTCAVWFYWLKKRVGSPATSQRAETQDQYLIGRKWELASSAAN